MIALVLCVVLIVASAIIVVAAWIVELFER